MSKHDALVGNPNCGKTTLFNALTGAHQHVGNWPGVTVERKTGTFQHQQQTFQLVDLPGVYDLNPNTDDGSLDVQVTTQYFEQHSDDVVINVVDASSLERNLYLTTQLLSLKRRVIVALNMTDVAEKLGIVIDTEKLSETLGCPVVPVVASRNRGLIDLKQAVSELLTKPCRAEKTHLLNLDAGTRYHEVEAIIRLTTHSTQPDTPSFTQYLDRLFLNRWLDFPLFLAVMYSLFVFTINIGGAFNDFFDGVAGAIFVDGVTVVLQSLHSPEWLIALLAAALEWIAGMALLTVISHSALIYYGRRRLRQPALIPLVNIS